MPLINRNKREGMDNIMLGRNVLAVISVVIMFAMFIMISTAWPRMGNMFNRFYGSSPIMDTYNMDRLLQAFYLVPFLTGITIIGLILNAMRHKRKYDRYSASLIIGLVVSIISTIIYFIYQY